MLRFNAYKKIFNSKQRGIDGNMKGDGTLLGAVYVIGPGNHGILYEHRELEFGDHHNTTLLLQALDQLRHLKASTKGEL